MMDEVQIEAALSAEKYSNKLPGAVAGNESPHGPGPVRIGRLAVRHIPRAQRFIPPDTFYTQN